MVDSNIIPPLIHLLSTAEFDIKKEAAWAISNATSGGTGDQIKYLVTQNCIKPLCDLLTCADPRIVVVALEGLENILKVRQLIIGDQFVSPHRLTCIKGFVPISCQDLSCTSPFLAFDVCDCSFKINSTIMMGHLRAREYALFTTYNLHSA